VVPSRNALRRIREKLRQLTPRGQPRTLTRVVQEVNTLRRGWAAYFRYGYPWAAFRALNHFVRGRFWTFLRRRSQRRARPFEQVHVCTLGDSATGCALSDAASRVLNLCALLGGDECP
jgi:hypothetical protein